MDSRPCVISLDWLQRGILLGLSCVVMMGMPVIMWFVWVYREVKVSMNIVANFEYTNENIF